MKPLHKLLTSALLIGTLQFFGCANILELDRWAVEDTEANSDSDTDTDPTSTDPIDDSDTTVDTDTDTTVDTNTDSDTNTNTGDCTLETAVCNAEGDAVQTDSCGNIRTTDCNESASTGLCRDGFCGCPDGFAGVDCTQCVVYVDASVPTSSTQNGASWPTAFSTIQQGIDLAATNDCLVWVAEGTYLPTAYANGDPDGTVEGNKTITLPSGIGVFGGFGGNEISMAQRDWNSHVTILSGDLEQDDNPSDIFIGDTDNVFHVVTGNPNTMLDGFTISDGNAINANVNNPLGGGYYISSTTDNTEAVVRNCRFVDNKAVSGGAMAVENQAQLRVEKCEFTNNQTQGLQTGDMAQGGAIFAATERPFVIVSSIFRDNQADAGGALASFRTAIRVANCSFFKNVALDAGGALNIRVSSTASIVNSLFANNTTTIRGGAMYLEASSAEVSNTTIVSNEVTTEYGLGTGGGISVNNGIQLHLFNSILWANTANKEGPQLFSTSGTTNDTRIENNILHGGCDDVGGPLGNCASHGSNLSSGPLLDEKHLPSPMSPCVDGGDSSLLPLDETDINNDGDTTSPIPIDLAGQPRVQGDTLDIGAFEAPQP